MVLAWGVYELEQRWPATINQRCKVLLVQYVKRRWADACLIEIVLLVARKRELGL